MSQPVKSQVVPDVGCLPLELDILAKSSAVQLSGDLSPDIVARQGEPLPGGQGAIREARVRLPGDHMRHQ